MRAVPVSTVGIWILRSARWVAAAVALTLFLAARPSAQGPTPASVLDAAALYITQFKQDLSAMVAEEVYSQEFRSLGFVTLGVHRVAPDAAAAVRPAARQSG